MTMEAGAETQSGETAVSEAQQIATLAQVNTII